MSNLVFKMMNFAVRREGPMPMRGGADGHAGAVADDQLEQGSAFPQRAGGGAGADSVQRVRGHLRAAVPPGAIY